MGLYQEAHIWCARETPCGTWFPTIITAAAAYNASALTIQLVSTLYLFCSLQYFQHLSTLALGRFLITLCQVHELLSSGHPRNISLINLVRCSFFPTST